MNNPAPVGVSSLCRPPEWRWWRLAIGVVSPVILLAGCGTDSDRNTGRADPKPPPATSVPWAQGPTDGAWDYGDVSFGQPTPTSQGAYGPTGDYVFTIASLPTLTTADNGKTVTMTSTMSVNRVYDRGFDEGISDGNFFSFNPGVLPGSVFDMNEAYGQDTDVNCQNDRPLVGETTTCTLAFTAPAEEIKNSYWTINSFTVGAWPSQIA